MEVSSSDVVHLLRAENASRGGLFLAGNPENYPQFREGVEVGLHICEVETEAPAEGDGDHEGVDVHARAKIVRIEEPRGERGGGGFAVEFVRLDDENKARLAELLSRSGT